MSIKQFVRRCAENTIMLVELEISRVPLKISKGKDN